MTQLSFTVCLALYATLCGAALGQYAIAQSPKIIIAHRGASGYLPEHTLEAVAMAHAMGADYLEQDVVLSKDGVPLVLHDIYVDTVTDVARRFPERKRSDGRYYAIDFTLAELKQLRVLERFDAKTGRPVFAHRFPQNKASFEVATLEEQLQLIQGLNETTGRQAGIYPEIKLPAWHRSQGQDATRTVLEMLARYGYRTKEDRFYVQCFNFAEVRRIRQELGFDGKLIQLLGNAKSHESPSDAEYLQTPAGLEEISKVADGVGPPLERIVRGDAADSLSFTNLVSTAHKLGLQVHPYTCRADDLPSYARSLEELFDVFLVQAGVDGVFTDHPDRGAIFLRNLSGTKER